MKGKCLIVDEMHSSLIPMLESLGLEPVYKPEIAKSDIEGIIADYEGLIVRSKMAVTDAFLEKAAKLKFIARAGAGIDLLDVEAIHRRNIYLFNAPEGNRDALAEHTVGLILALLNKICFGHQEVVSGHWNREANRGYELKEKTVAVFGFGYMGRAVAEKLSCFNCRILGFDKKMEKVDPALAEPASLETVFAESDLVSFHIPLDQETRGMVNSAFFEKFAKPVWLINTARGEILKLTDLLFALKEDKVKGAALDVLENEKSQTWSAVEKNLIQELAATGKVIFTPHVGGWSHESYVRINSVLVEKIKKSGLFS